MPQYPSTEIIAPNLIQIIHVNKMFMDIPPSVLGYPHLWNTPFISGDYIEAFCMQPPYIFTISFSTLVGLTVSFPNKWGLTNNIGEPLEFDQQKQHDSEAQQRSGMNLGKSSTNIEL